MKVYFIVLLFTIVNLFAYPQNYGGRFQGAGNDFGGTIKGKVIDSNTGVPVSFANIVVFKSKDSSSVNGAVSDDNGNFTIDKIFPGKYYAKITFIGYKTYTVDNILVTPKNKIADLGTIKVVASTVNLKPVVVNGQKEMMVTNLDKQVINVEKDLSSAGGTAMDVMQNIPALTVDIDGNISLRGNSNVTILIDGKPSGLSGINSSDVLTEIPASSIKSVELVTNPSAKYDPDGTAGIINIVLKKRTNLGLNGVFNLNGGTGSKYTGGTNFNYRTGDLNFFGDISGRMFRSSRTGLSDRTNDYNGNISYTNQNSIGVFNMNMENIHLGSDYLLDDFNTLSLSLQFRDFYVDNSGAIYNYLYDNTNSLNNYFVDNNSGTRGVKSLTYMLDYKREYETKGKELTADVIYSNNSMSGEQNTDYNYYTINDSAAAIPPSLVNNNSSNTHNMLILQSDFIQPFDESNRIELGYKSSISDLGMGFNFFNYDQGIGSWIYNPLRSDNFDYKEQIHALYGIYTGAIGNFKFQGGLRGEEAITKAVLLTNATNYNKQYFSLYPSIYFAYDFSPLNEFKINYSRRVDRPKIWQLNPFVNYSDSLNLTYGNPDLSPEYTNSYEMGYSTYFFGFNWYSSLFYKETNGLITQISRLAPGGITESTFENIASEKNYGIELLGNGSIFNWWKINANVSYFRADINDPEFVTGSSNYSFSWTGRINSSWMLSKTLSLQISSTYNSPAVSAQGRTNALYFTDFAMKQDLMKGDLSITLRISDIFNTRRFGSERYGNGFTLFTQGQQDSRIVFLGLTYNLNNFKQSKDKVKDIPTDDEMQTE